MRVYARILLVVDEINNKYFKFIVYKGGFMLSIVQKKIAVIVVLIVGLLAGSIYHYSLNSAPPVVVSAQDQAQSPAKEKHGVVVYISGAVIQPGVLSVAVDSRVIDAINQAGGLAPGADVSKINLAQKVKDGMHVTIPGNIVEGQMTEKSGAGSKININTADPGQLDKLPGIGAATANKVIEYRNANGPFHSLDDLKKVSGIGEAKYTKLKDRITI